MQLISLYAYDPSGQLPANKVVEEGIVVTPQKNIKDWSYVCPRAAPFFADSLVVKDGKGASARTLIENVDYRIVFDFVSASVHLKRRICCGIALLNPQYSGTIYVTYQALGGNFTMSDFSILEEIVRNRYKTVHVAYEQIINLPKGFAPAWHEHNVKDMVSMSAVVEKLKAIADALLNRGSGSWDQLDRLINHHINSTQAHIPANVGLGNVKNYGIATRADVTAGKADKYVTADTLKAVIGSIDMSGYATTTAMNAAIKTAVDNSAKSINTSNAEALNSAVTTLNNSINTLRDNSATKTELQQAIAATRVDVSSYATQTYVTNSVNTLKTQIPDIVNPLIDAKITAGLGTNGVITNKINETKTELTNLINTIKTTLTISIDNATDKANAADTKAKAVETSLNSKYTELNNKIVAIDTGFRYNLMTELAVTTNTTVNFSAFVNISNATDKANFLKGKQYKAVSGAGELTIILDTLAGVTNDQVKGIPFNIHNRTNKVMKIIGISPNITKLFDPYSTATVVCKATNQFDIIGGYTKG